MSSNDEQSGLGDRLSGSLFGGETRSADYQAWADRLRAKRDKAKQFVADHAEPSTENQASYWSTDALFAESARVRDHEAATACTAREMADRKVQLASDLGLRGEISLSSANNAWRRLAKLHHPDRYLAADQSVQDHHAAEMIKVNTAYAALKKLLLFDA